MRPGRPLKGEGGGCDLPWWEQTAWSVGAEAKKKKKKKNQHGHHEEIQASAYRTGMWIQWCGSFAVKKALVKSDHAINIGIFT